MELNDNMYRAHPMTLQTINSPVHLCFRTKWQLNLGLEDRETPLANLRIKAIEEMESVDSYSIAVVLQYRIESLKISYTDFSRCSSSPTTFSMRLYAHVNGGLRKGSKSYLLRGVSWFCYQRFASDHGLTDSSLESRFRRVDWADIGVSVNCLRLRVDSRISFWN